jgi:hypothetical protein
MRSLASLGLLAFAGVSTACPWWSRCCPRPAYYYPPCSPSVVRVVEAPPPEPVKKPEVAKKDAAPDGWCHIHGRVVFDGDPIPKQAVIPKSGGAYTEDWVVNGNNRGVKNVVVWLLPELSNDQLEALRTRRLREVPSFGPDQIYPDFTLKGERSFIFGKPMRAYIPHIVTAQAGSDLVIRNLSQEPHNVKMVSTNNGQFNVLLPPSQHHQVAGLRTERFPIEFASSIYPWMRAYLWVFNHPYFAVTDPDGNFEIKFAPKGNLRLVVWQEAMGFRNGRDGRWGEAIKVPSGRLDLGEIKLKPPKN